MYVLFSVSFSLACVKIYTKQKVGGGEEGKKKITVMNHPKENEVKISCFHSHERLKAEENIYLDQLIYHNDCSCFPPHPKSFMVLKF